VLVLERVDLAADQLDLLDVTGDCCKGQHACLARLM
jgi:hypothetical protein